MREFVQFLAAASPGAHLIEDHGVSAAVVPATPRRSIVNSAVFTDAAGLAAAWPALDDAYAEAGIGAWAVWVPEPGEDAIALLGERGHRFDGDPVAMVLELDRFEPSGRELAEWDDRATFEEIGRTNDEAYGSDEEYGLRRAFGAPPPGLPLRAYRALAGGEVASVMVTLDHGDDLGVYWVATPPRFRGIGLAGGLLERALIAARERGMRTSSLQSSRLGEPVYRRLGYEPAFRYRLYERRRAES